jgi:hypothetical protein
MKMIKFITPVSLLLIIFTTHAFCDDAKLEKFGRLIGPCKIQQADFARIKQLVLSVEEPTSYTRPRGVTNRDVSLAAIYFAWDESDLLKKQIAEIPTVDIAGLKKQIDLLDQAISTAVDDITKNQAVQADRVIEILSAISKRIEGNTDILKLQSTVIVGILDGVEEQLKALQKISDQLDSIENGVKQANDRLDSYTTAFSRVEKSQGDIKNILEAMRLAEEEENRPFEPKRFFLVGGGVFKLEEKGCPKQSAFNPTIEGGGRLIFGPANLVGFVGGWYVGGSVGFIIKGYGSVNFGAIYPDNSQQKIYPFSEANLEIPLKDWLSLRIGVRVFPWDNKIQVQVGFGAF